MIRLGLKETIIGAVRALNLGTVKLDQAANFAELSQLLSIYHGMNSTVSIISPADEA